MSTFKDKLKFMEGIFKLYIFNRDGKLVDYQEDKNLIVISGRNTMSKLLGESLNDRRITKIGFADDVSEEDENTTEFSDSYIKSLDNYTYPSETSVKFVWSLDFGEYNENVITNYGLFTEDEHLFAMKVRPSITKDEYIAINGEWTVLL